jgi:hypothetical protein
MTERALKKSYGGYSTNYKMKKNEEPDEERLTK